MLRQRLCWQGRGRQSCLVGPRRPEPAWTEQPTHALVGSKLRSRLCLHLRHNHPPRQHPQTHLVLRRKRHSHLHRCRGHQHYYEPCQCSMPTCGAFSHMHVAPHLPPALPSSSTTREKPSAALKTSATQQRKVLTTLWQIPGRSMLQDQVPHHRLLRRLLIPLMRIVRSSWVPECPMVMLRPKSRAATHIPSAT
jgi:hypothetical protein